MFWVIAHWVIYGVSTVVVVVLGLWALWAIGVGVCTLGKLFTYDLYRHWKYTQRGVCPGCHRPLVRTVYSVDQLYGADTVAQTACLCGTKTLPQGDRRGADW